MVDALDGIEAKLRRADTHFEAVKAALEPLAKADPDVILGEFDRKSGKYLFRSQRDSERPDWLSPVIGDYVHNLRAALDYIVWAMTTAAVRTDPKKAVKVEFPIFADEVRFANQAPQKILGIPDGAKTVIKCLQPFNGPDCRPSFNLAHPTRRPLWRLYELDNWDKHRALNLTEAVGEHSFVLPPELDIKVPPEPMRFGHGGFKRGAVFASFDLRRPEGDVEMYLRTTYYVAFDRNGPESVAAEPVLQTLDDIRREVRDRILPRLIQFLPKR
jgi:hypothetical protein